MHHRRSRFGSNLFALDDARVYALVTVPITLMEEHLTVAEAREFTGKSESTLKRMIRDIVADAEHPDRQYILPTHEKMEQHRAAGEPYRWKIARDLLERRYPRVAVEEGSANRDTTSNAQPDELVAILREQLLAKDDQIEHLHQQLKTKDDQLGSLDERLRESHVLLKDLQQRIQLPAPRPSFADRHLPTLKRILNAK